jgi:hypothetical protein
VEPIVLSGEANGGCQAAPFGYSSAEEKSVSGPVAFHPRLNFLRRTKAARQDAGALARAAG